MDTLELKVGSELPSAILGLTVISWPKGSVRLLSRDLG